MKKILLLIFAFISINAFSQIKVKNNSFRKIEGYVMLDKKDHTDMNDAPMALIKIATENINAEERRKFTFKGNAETYFDWTFEPGEIYLYVSAAAATFIEIIHEDYGKYEFKLPYDLCDYCGYDMVVEYLGTKENDGYLVVKSDQANAKIYIDEEEIGEQIVLKQFIIGTTHTWMIECDNYHTESGKVTIKAGKNVIEKKMRPVFVDVIVRTDSESSIYIDDEYKSKGTWTGKLPEGKHIFEAKKVNHKTMQKSIEVVSGVTKSIVIENPKPITGTVDITTLPADAKIYIDGKYYGQTPNTINMIVGEHELKLEKEACLPIMKSIIVKADKVLTINEKLQTGKDVTIKTIRNGDNVYIDDEYVGKTPLKKHLLFGNHNVKVMREDETAYRNIDVNAVDGQDEFIIYYGHFVTFDSNKKGDVVFVDGEKQGKTPMELDIAYGNHKVTVKRNQKIETRDLYISSSSKSYYMFNPTKETLKEFNDNGVRFIMANASVSSSIMNLVDLPSDLRDPAKLSYGLSFGSYNSIGWYMSIMTSFNVTDSVVYTGATQFFPGFQGGVSDYNTLTENVVNSRISAMLGIMVRVVGPVYLKLGGGYGLYSKYYQTDKGDWYRSYESKDGWQMTGGLQFNMKHLILSADVVTDQNFDVFELKLGLGFGWKKK